MVTCTPRLELAVEGYHYHINQCTALYDCEQLQIMAGPSQGSCDDHTNLVFLWKVDLFVRLFVRLFHAMKYDVTDAPHHKLIHMECPALPYPYSTVKVTFRPNPAGRVELANVWRESALRKLGRDSRSRSDFNGLKVCSDTSSLSDDPSRKRTLHGG